MLSFSEIAQLCATIDPSVTLMVEGEMGIGKSSIGAAVAAARTVQTGVEHTLVMLDCTNISEGDVMIPLPVTVTHGKGKSAVASQQVQYAPNTLMHVGQDTPIILMLDELPKAPKPVRDMLMPIMLEQRVGEFRLPAGSQVIATGNLTDEGLGDSMEAHHINRTIVVEMRKPTSDEWGSWAGESGISGEVIAFTRQFPTVFQSYRECTAKENSYISHPQDRSRRQVVTPRSLAAADKIVRVRHLLPSNTTLDALTGAIGEAAARDFMTILTLSDALPDLQDVRTGRETKQPKSAISQLICGFNLIRGCLPEHVGNVLRYVASFEAEIRAVVLTTIIREPTLLANFQLEPEFIAQLTAARVYL